MTTPDLTVETVSLLAYTPPLRLGSCCAKPQNAIHKAEVQEVVRWLEERGYHITGPNDYPEPDRD